MPGLTGVGQGKTNRSIPYLSINKAIWINRTELTEIIRIGRSKVSELMQEKWIENVHWVRPAKTVLYNLPLILDWVANCGDPQAHQRAIEAYLKSLPSNKTA